MTEVAIREDRAPVAIEDYHDAAYRRLHEWAASAQAAHQVAQSLVRTSFVPEGFRGKPDEATAAILAGAEVGLSPLAALRSFDVIQGTAAPRAITLRAIVQSFGHEVVVDESTATRCRVRARRRGSENWQTVTWTIERAQQLGVTNKANWKNQPQAMLVARATSEACRLIAADAILGIGYSAEEVSDGAEPQVAFAEAEQQEEPPRATRTMRRRAPADSGPVEPPAGDVSEASQAPGPEPDHITDAQQRKMRALLADLGLSGPGMRPTVLALVSDVVGREVESSKSLTVAEATRVIDHLIAEAAQQGVPQDAEIVEEQS